jgi:hypothetical protein
MMKWIFKGVNRSFQLPVGRCVLAHGSFEKLSKMSRIFRAFSEALLSVNKRLDFKSDYWDGIIPTNDNKIIGQNHRIEKCLTFTRRYLWMNTPSSSVKTMHITATDSKKILSIK